MTIFHNVENSYWESIKSIVVKYLGSEIQDIGYNDQLQALLNLTDETIVFQYYKDNPQEYCLWLVALRTEKFSVEVSYDAVFQWQNKPEDFIKYENALLNILELATPICIDSN
jgi:hypothetical protein